MREASPPLPLLRDADSAKRFVDAGRHCAALLPAKVPVVRRGAARRSTPSSTERIRPSSTPLSASSSSLALPSTTREVFSAPRRRRPIASRKASFAADGEILRPRRRPEAQPFPGDGDAAEEAVVDAVVVVGGCDAVVVGGWDDEAVVGESKAPVRAFPTAAPFPLLPPRLRSRLRISRQYHPAAVPREGAVRTVFSASQVVAAEWVVAKVFAEVASAFEEAALTSAVFGVVASIPLSSSSSRSSSSSSPPPRRTMKTSTKKTRKRKKTSVSCAWPGRDPRPLPPRRRWLPILREKIDDFLC